MSSTQHNVVLLCEYRVFYHDKTKQVRAEAMRTPSAAGSEEIEPNGGDEQSRCDQQTMNHHSQC
jgi:hypothetical protein